MKKRRLAGFGLGLCIMMVILTGSGALASGIDIGSLLGGMDTSSLYDMIVGMAGSGASSGSQANTSSDASSAGGLGMILDMLGVTERAMKDCTVSAISDQTYTGSAITPAPVVKYNGTRLKKGTDYTATYSNNTKVGTAKITLRGKGNYTGTKTVSFKIVRKNGSKKSSSGSTDKNKTKKFTVKLTTTSYVYNGNVRKPAVKVTVSGKTVAKTDYTVTYKGNKAVGRATVTVKGKGDYKGYEGEATFKITLKKTVLQSASAAGGGNVSCRWNADTQADGYQIGYATNKTFQNAKTLKVEGGSKKTAQLSKLTAGKNYYVRIRSYKKVGASNWYSEWSAGKSVKVK
ncbi:MAG: fibronectin type III domain-containing protein [Lachnospiraceae bacterium]|nr:fibronectin type III domain-containing protein [Lachnospiraceae bacterium]